MAIKKTVTKKAVSGSPKPPLKLAKKIVGSKSATEPIFPYTNKPGTLRKLLQEIPLKPRPSRIDSALMQSWGFRDTNDMSTLRVLKAMKLLSPTNEPTELYARFMSLNGGASELAAPLRELYAPLFNASHAPYKESPEVLKNLFHIHSGGSSTTLDYQVQTFKALAESTDFDLKPAASINAQLAPSTPHAGQGKPHAEQSRPISAGSSSPPTGHIDLHIHLPENKTRRDYETMIEDIGRYIYGRNVGESRG